jgi:hypothetical protein
MLFFCFSMTMAAISFGFNKGAGMTNGLPLSKLLAAFKSASVYAFMSLTLSKLGAAVAYTRDYTLAAFTTTTTGFFAATTTLALTGALTDAFAF